MSLKKYKNHSAGNGAAEITIYIFVTYGINFLIGLPLLLNHCVEPELFSMFMVLLPANGVFLVKKYRRDISKDYCIVHRIMLALLLVSLLTIILRALGIINGEIAYNAAAIFSVIGSVGLIASIWLRKDGKGLFYNFELIHKDIVVFILLLVGKGVFDYIGMASKDLQSISGLIFGFVGIPFMFFFNACAFLGEEYGWRGFLQDKMQIRCGKRIGVIFLKRNIALKFGDYSAVQYIIYGIGANKMGGLQCYMR